MNQILLVLFVGTHAVFRDVTFGSPPHVCQRVHKCACAQEVAAVISTILLRNDFDFDVVDYLTELAVSPRGKFRECMRGQLYFLKWALALTDDMMDHLFRLNQDLVEGTHPRATLLAVPRNDDHRRLNFCNIHRWYQVVFEGNIGKSLSEVTLLSHYAGIYKGIPVIRTWRPDDKGARYILEQELQRFQRGSVAEDNKTHDPEDPIDELLRTGIEFPIDWLEESVIDFL